MAAMLQSVISFPQITEQASNQPIDCFRVDEALFFHIRRTLRRSVIYFVQIDEHCYLVRVIFIRPSRVVSTAIEFVVLQWIAVAYFLRVDGSTKIIIDKSRV